MKFKKFESKYYDFYLFSSLVKSLVTVPNKLSVPYDIEMKIIYSSYKKINWSLLEEDLNLSPYDLLVKHIKEDFKLVTALVAFG